ncbi:MAG: hypothetical protein A2X46_05385 [Lentisphaerae bacterium GWF2_57_35]|nr:MAG: hypothetical protein A2X46_05385 [Lentisphaerae bacterium GWF2_57_35]
MKPRSSSSDRRPRRLSAFLIRLMCLVLLTCLAQAVFAENSPVRLPTKSAVEYLAKVMDQYHHQLYVYSDFISAGNHFLERGLMCNPNDEDSVPPMDENCTQQPYAGSSCIKCTFIANKSNWGGWFFLNGAFLPRAKAPILNWGDVPQAGINLKGATALSFWARGEKGDERVKFFCFGTGRDSFSGKTRKPFPDSASQSSSGYVKLTKEWKKYTINLAGKNLTNTLLGFAWQTKSTINGHKDIVFFLDEISYDKTRLNEPRFLSSYQTIKSDDEFDLILRNTAYTYDNALALLAFMGNGDLRRAKLIADALLYAQKNDRFYSDGRIRNAYQSGDLTLPAGWAPSGKKGAVRIPGWWDFNKHTWLEDRTSTGTYAGNVAWAMLALLSYYEVAGGEEYLASAQRMGEWVERHCRDERGVGGYTAGYEGWEPSMVKLTYKATEHNIDLVAVFQRLHRITGQALWQTRAHHAQKFVNSMWDSAEGKFWTGTGDDGETIFKDVIPLDAQAWGLMALRSGDLPLSKGLQYAESKMAVGKGYDFNQDSDGVWFEGTAQMAAAFAFNGQNEKHHSLMGFLKASQDASGGLYASDREVITTGFHLKEGDPWLYYKRLHVGATAWMALAEKTHNPFWMGSDLDDSLAFLKKDSRLATK